MTIRNMTTSQVYIIKIEILFQNLAEQDINNRFLVNYLLNGRNYKIKCNEKVCMCEKKKKEKERNDEIMIGKIKRLRVLDWQNLILITATQKAEDKFSPSKRRKK